MQELNELNGVIISDHFKFVKELGEGSFGKVILAESDLLSKQVAIKIIDRCHLQKNEYTLLAECNHENIVKLYKVKFTRKNCFIIMDYIEGETLDHYLKNHTLNEQKIIIIIKQILSALIYIHQKGIIHRDLKPQNIIVQKNTNKIILIDFGLGYKMNFIVAHDFCGTPQYVAPEVVQQQDYNKTVDVFSLGIIQFKLFTEGRHPFWQQKTDIHTYYEKLKAFDFEIDWPDNMSNKARDFFKKTAAYNPNDRMTTYQCQDHPWISGNDKQIYPITLNQIQSLFQFQQSIENIIKFLIVLRYIKNNSRKEIKFIEQMQYDNKEIKAQEEDQRNLNKRISSQMSSGRMKTTSMDSSPKSQRLQKRSIQQCSISNLWKTPQIQSSGMQRMNKSRSLKNQHRILLPPIVRLPKINFVTKSPQKMEKDQ